MSSYAATVIRDGRWWMVRVAGINGLTQARHLAEVERMAREFVAVSLNEPIGDIDVTVTVVSAGRVTDIDKRLERIRLERDTAAEMDRAARRETTELARALVAEDVPLRDVGAILGISHQRAHQLVKS